LRANSNALGSQTKYWRLIMQYGKSQEAIDRLTAQQRRVTQEAGTERPFTGEYNDLTEPGIYVDTSLSLRRPTEGEYHCN
jgi:SelR domain